MEKYRGLLYLKQNWIYVHLRNIFFACRQVCMKVKIWFYYKNKIEKSDYIVKFHRPAVSFYLPYYHMDLIQMSILLKRTYYEFDYLEFVCKEWNNGCIEKRLKNQAILDIGSNIGNHSLYYLLECHASCAYIFEPVKDTFSIMKRNIEINGLSEKVKLYNAGVGEKDSKADIGGYSRSNTGGATLRLNEAGDIPIVAIDELAIDMEIALVKVDTEGFEVAVIKGMLGVIRKWRPYIMIEIQKPNRKEINDILFDMGYLYLQYDEFNFLYYCEE